MSRSKKAAKRLPDGLDPRLTLSTVVKAMKVQEVIGEAGRPLSLAEIASAAGIDRSAAQRIVHTLEGLGYLQRGEGRSGFRPAQRVLDRCFDFLRMDPLIERATPVLLELRRSTRERVDLSLLDGTMINYAVRLQSKRETFFATLIGRRLPAVFTSGGRAMMARMDDTEVDALLDRSELKAYTPKTIADRAGIWRKVREARSDGYALVQEEIQIGEVVLGAAITDREGRPVAAVHIAGSLSQWSPRIFRAQFSPLAMEATRALSQ
ncbi:MAG: helix-turn-helix domain-containing protein [Alphaproteobacteria bacterium]|nr:helix-turn-helix domain-containing protein [Alphaproteobacteria bacterium]MCW5740281.1 helix-turn-helix domain-containing protein [Alphaproteobacteria bacterium]